ncbi:MAG: hypothetical protein RMJ87_07010 [Cytophagales bacterium]|nr:hypothetical protein [Bernardetiaceae bacterium]MDW8204760.1 hypothetical protein [Cytophagales bacterium]
MAYATIDESRLPIVLITFSDKEPTRKEFDDYLNAMYAIYARRKPVSFVFDATQVRYLSSEFRIKQGNWIKRHKDLIAEVQKCFVFVIPNLLVRFILDAILMISPLPAPYVIVKTVEEGLQEAAKRMQLVAY